jgi:hypothetical protein
MFHLAPSSLQFIENTFINLIKFATKHYHKYKGVCCKFSNIPTPGLFGV